MILQMYTLLELVRQYFLQHCEVLTEENKPMNYYWVQFDKGTFRDNNIFVVIATFYTSLKYTSDNL